MAKGKRTHGRLSIFKGREAKLNYAVFQVLSLKGPQTIYGIHKSIKAQKNFRDVGYATVNKRVRVLEKSGYVRKAVKKTATAPTRFIYELTKKAQLSILLDTISLEGLFTKLDEASAAAILDILRRTQISADFKK